MNQYVVSLLLIPVILHLILPFMLPFTSSRLSLSPQSTSKKAYHHILSSVAQKQTFVCLAEQFLHDLVMLFHRFKECCDALEANTGELGDVEQLMNNLQVSSGISLHHYPNISSCLTNFVTNFVMNLYAFLFFQCQGIMIAQRYRPSTSHSIASYSY